MLMEFNGNDDNDEDGCHLRKLSPCPRVEIETDNSGKTLSIELTANTTLFMLSLSTSLFEMFSVNVFVGNTFHSRWRTKWCKKRKMVSKLQTITLLALVPSNFRQNHSLKHCQKIFPGSLFPVFKVLMIPTSPFSHHSSGFRFFHREQI